MTANLVNFDGETLTKHDLTPACPASELFKLTTASPTIDALCFGIFELTDPMIDAVHEEMSEVRKR